MKGLAHVSAQAIDDFLWGRKFGKIEGKEIVWKYGNPYLYPTDEFEQLKTIILATFAAEEFISNRAKTAPADIAAALNIPAAEKEKAKKLSQGMADYFKGPMV